MTLRVLSVQTLATPTAAGQGTVLLLLALNLLILAFFILLNSLATPPKDHAVHVLERMQDGLAHTPRVTGPGGAAEPVLGQPWQDRAEAEVRGAVLGKIAIRTVPLEASADRLVLELPGRVLETPSVVRALQGMARQWDVGWALHGGTASQATALWQAVGQRVSWVPEELSGPGTEAMVQVTLRPRQPEAGLGAAALQRAAEDAGGRGEGQAVVAPEAARKNGLTP